MNNEIQLVIPATAQMMLVARMTLAGFCCQCGADVDTLDDIRTLSDEACYCLMHQAKRAQSLYITASQIGEQVHIRFEAKHASASSSARALHDIEIARGILGSLATNVQLDHSGGEMYAIEVAVRIGPI